MAKIKFRRDTAAAWTTANPILAQGEPGFEHDTGKFKIGDGVTDWARLAYTTGDAASLTDDRAVAVTVGNTEYFAIVNRANNNDNGVEASGVAYDSEDNMITLHVSEVNVGNGQNIDRLIISKFSSTGALLWQKQITQDVDVDQAHDLAIDSNDNIFVAASVDNGSEPDTVAVMKLNGSTGAVLWQKDYKSTVETTGVEGDFTPVDYTPFSTTLPGVGTPAQGLAVAGDWSNIPLGWTFRSSPGNGTYTTLGTILGVQYNSGTDQTTLYFAPATLDDPLPNDPTYYSATGIRNSSTIELGAMVLSGTDIFVASRYQEGEGLDNVGHLMKLSATDGTLDWAVTFDLLAETEVYGMDVTTDGDPVLVGTAFPDGAPPAFYATRFSGTDGSAQWTQFLFDPETGVEYSGADIVIDSQNNIFVSVNSLQNIVHDIGDNTSVTIAHIIKLNSSGAIQWTRRVGPGPCASVATGIDCDSTGNVYLAALTSTQDRPTREVDDFFTGRNVLAVAKYSTSGAVLWQRYIESDKFEFASTRDDGTGTNNYDHIENRGRCMSVNNSGKLAIQVTAREIDADDYTENEIYWESITFQIDQDGRTMTVGSGNAKFTVKESRIPGRFITLSGSLETDPAMPNFNDFTEDMSVINPELSLEDGELAQVLIKSAAYEYVFGNDGTLTIPNDGDIKLTQTQLGWFSIFGRANNDNYDLWIRSNCVDPATGCVYAVGQDDDDSRGFIAKYDVDGNILWSVKLDDDSRCNAVKIHPVTGNVVVLAEYYGNFTTASIIEIDPDTAKVVRSSGFRDDNDNGSCVPFDFEITGSGAVVVVGRKYDEFNSTLVTAQTGSGVGTLLVLRSAVAGTPNNSDWYVSGGSITGRTVVDNVDRYPGLTSTVRQGSGSVTFNINDNGDGTYSLVSFNAEGTSNYLAGHKLKILGSLIGGVDSVNDAVLTITAIDPGGVIESISGTIEGTAAGVAPASYTNVAAINHQTGSGCTATLRFSTDGSISDVWSFNTPGSNYVIGDVLTFAGTQFPGGTSPANDITMTVIDNGAVNNGVNGTGSLAGSIPTTYWRIGTTAQTPNYSIGSYSLLSPAGAEAFIVKGENNGQGEFDLVWTKVLGGGSTNDDRYFSVATDSSGNWYAAGEVYAQNNAAGSDLNSYWCAVISKFNSSGVHQWTKYLNDTLDNCYARAVAVQGNTVAVTHENNSNGRTVITKLDLSGNIKWQRETNSGDDSSVAVDTNGDIYVVAETFMESQYANCIKVIRLNTYGEVVWRKILATQIDEGTSTDERFKNGRNLTIDSTHLYVSGYTSAFDNDYDSGFLVKIPKSGDADGIYGGWTVMNDAYDVDKINSTEAGSFNPVVSIGDFETVSFDWSTNWFDPSGDNYYHTLEIIRDRDGGAIEFADGTRQTSSAQQIPQKKIFNGADHRLSLEDMGKHIYVTNNSTKICVPYHQDNPLPVGFTVVIINNSGNPISIDGDGINMYITVPGIDTAQYWDLESPGMATLIKVDDNRWFMTGNVTVD